MAGDYIDPDANLPYPESPEYPSASVRDLDAPPDDRVLEGGGVVARNAAAKDAGPVGGEVDVSAGPLAEDVGMGAIEDERGLISSAGGNSLTSRSILWLEIVIMAIIVVIVIIGFVSMHH